MKTNEISRNDKTTAYTHKDALRILAVFPLITAILGVDGVALAQDTQALASADWKISLGLGGAYRPDYEGSKDYTPGVMPDFAISYRDIVFLRGPSLGVNVITVNGPNGRDKFQVGPIVRYRPGRDQDDNDALHGLGDIDPSVEVGGFVRYAAGPVSAEVMVVQDVAGGHDGVLVEASVGYGIPINASLRANLRAASTWASDNYMQTYFGISSVQASRSTRTPFDAHAGLKDIGLSLGVEYDVTEHWGIGGRIGYTRLLGDAADSPIVRDAGSADQVMTSVSARYRF